MPAAIHVSDITKTFRRDGKPFRALDGLSFSVEPGEMVALIGASGSGKSTLIRNIAGLTLGDRGHGAGEVAVFGEAVQGGGRMAHQARRSRVRVAVIFQQFNLVGRLSLLTNVLLGHLGRMPAWRATFGLFSRAEKLAAMEALHRVGMHEYARQRASTLSGGQQQRAAIARALVQRAEIVLADEPIASLDPESARRVMDNLARINRTDGITVVVSLHQVDFAIRYCPRTVAMRAGRIVYDGPSTALSAAFLKEIYGAAAEELILAGPLAQAQDDETAPLGLGPAAALLPA
jgi:phosphonate transport system ATP-binding protein